MIPSCTTSFVVGNDNKYVDDDETMFGNNSSISNIQLFDKDMDQDIANVMEDVIINHVPLEAVSEEDIKFPNGDEDEENDKDIDEDNDEDENDNNHMMETRLLIPEYYERMTDVISFNDTKNCYIDTNTNTNTNTDTNKNMNTNNGSKNYCDSNYNYNRNNNGNILIYDDSLFKDYDVMFPLDMIITMD